MHLKESRRKKGQSPLPQLVWPQRISRGLSDGSRAGGPDSAADPQQPPRLPGHPLNEATGAPLRSLITPRMSPTSRGGHAWLPPKQQGGGESTGFEIRQTWLNFSSALNNNKNLKKKEKKNSALLLACDLGHIVPSMLQLPSRTVVKTGRGDPCLAHTGFSTVITVPSPIDR